MQFSVDFRGSPFLETSRIGSSANRLNWRTEILFTRNLNVVKNKRVLDLASHDGRFSYACLALGAKHVTGVEGRRHLVENANRNLESLGCESSAFEFLEGDAVEYLSNTEPGAFDTVLCLGFFYHTIYQIELLESFARVKPDYLVLDTFINQEIERGAWIRRVRNVRPRHLKMLVTKPGEVAGPTGPSLRSKGVNALVFKPESHVGEGATTDSIDIVAWPTKSFIETFLQTYGFNYRQLHWDKREIKDWDSIGDYRKGDRVSYLAQLGQGE